MKRLKVITYCVMLVVFSGGCGEMTPQQRQAWSGLSQTLSHMDQQYYYSQPETIVIPGSEPVKLESWRYGQLPDNYVLPSQNPALFPGLRQKSSTLFPGRRQKSSTLFPGRRQESSTYWQEKNAEDEYWKRQWRQSRFSLP